MTTNELPREPNELDRLVAAARAGDRPAFDELVRRTYVDTYTLALRLTAHEEDARDVVQETYLRAWKGLKGFRGDAQFTTWLYRITANTAYTTVKRRRRHRADALDAMLEEPVETAHRGAARGVGRAVGAAGAAVGRARAPAAEAPGARGAEGRLRPVPRGDRRGARDLGRRRPRSGSTGAASACATCCTTRTRSTKGGVTMQCDDVARLLPEAVEGGAAVEIVGAAPHRDLPALPGRARPLPQDAPGAAAPAHPLPRARARACSRRRWRRSRRRASAKRSARSCPAAGSRTRVPSAARRWPPVPRRR